MNSSDTRRLNFLFEIDNIKIPLMNYIAPGITLKVVTDLGSKDANGNKKRFYEENRYPSNKYGNTDYLVSSSLRLNTYLSLEYPNPNYQKGDNGLYKSKVLFIRPYAMDDLIDTMKAFNKNFTKSFGIKNGELYIRSDVCEEATVHITIDSTLSFKPDIYETMSGDRRETGVRLTINDEYSTIISGETTWPEMVYKISRCDLTVLGLQMVQSYMAMLPGMAVSDIEKGTYNSTSKFVPFWEDDPDYIANAPGSVQINKPRRLSNEEKKKEFLK